jgi:hypothetical protein
MPYYGPGMSSSGSTDTNYATGSGSYEPPPDGGGFFGNIISSQTNPSLNMGGTGYGGTPAAPNPDYLANARTWGTQQGLQTGLINAAPDYIQNQMAQQSANIGIMGALANQQQQTGWLNQDYQTGLQRNDLAQQGNQIDIGANARQPGYLTALHNIAGQQYDLTRQGQQGQADINQRALEAQLTGRGAFTSVGGQQGRYDIAQNLIRGLQGTNLQQQGETTRFNEGMAQTQDQKQKLDLAAQGLGIDRNQLGTELQRGLDRLNLSTGTTVADLMNKVNSSNLQDQALGRKIFNDALNSSDYYARLYPGQNAANQQVQSIGGATDVQGYGAGQTYGGGVGRLQ